MPKTVRPAADERADRSLKGRLRDLAAKFMSLKFVVFLVGTGLLIAGLIDGWTWLVLAAAVMGIRTLEKDVLKTATRNGE